MGELERHDARRRDPHHAPDRLGANTALRDARLLCQMLTAVARGERDLLAAVGDYETDMREYGHAAVRAADQRRQRES